METMLTTIEAAKMIGVHPGTLVAWRMIKKRTGQLVGPPYFRLGRRAIRYLEADVYVWIRSGGVAN